MSVQYKLARNLTPNEEGKQPLHARFVPNGTMRLDDLVKNASGRSSLSSADIKGALQLLQDVIADALMFGYNIELEGIGTFGLTLKCRPVMNEKEIRAESVHFRDVTFRSSSVLRNRLKTIPVVRCEKKEKEGYTSLQCEELAMAYLQTHPYISSKTYCSLCHCGKTKASADLKRMTAEGKLKRECVGNTFLFSISDSF